MSPSFSPFSPFSISKEGPIRFDNSTHLSNHTPHLDHLHRARTCPREGGAAEHTSRAAVQPAYNNRRKANSSLRCVRVSPPCAVREGGKGESECALRQQRPLKAIQHSTPQPSRHPPHSNPPQLALFQQTENTHERRGRETTDLRAKARERGLVWRKTEQTTHTPSISLRPCVKRVWRVTLE